MTHKFRVGDFVNFRPTGSKEIGLFKVIKRLPEEFRAADWRYRIKSDQEGFERTVFEWDLSPSIIPEALPEQVNRLKRVSNRK